MSDLAHAEHHAGAHEKRDVAYPPVVLTSLVIAALVLLSFVTMWWLLNFMTAQEIAGQGQMNALTTAARRELPPEPRLQVDPILDIQALHATEKKVLESYGWVDQSAGVVRLPIERAIELTAERGLPTRSAAK